MKFQSSSTHLDKTSGNLCYVRIQI